MKRIVRTTLNEHRLTVKDKRELARLAALPDNPIDYSDIPPLTDEQWAGMVRFRDRQAKVPVSFRIDARVLAWLKSKGEGHLTRINDILTNVMEAERRTELRSHGIQRASKH